MNFCFFSHGICIYVVRNSSYKGWLWYTQNTGIMSLSYKPYSFLCGPDGHVIAFNIFELFYVWHLSAVCYVINPYWPQHRGLSSVILALSKGKLDINLVGKLTLGGTVLKYWSTLLSNKIWKGIILRLSLLKAVHSGDWQFYLVFKD